MFRKIIFEKGLRRRPITPVSNFSIDDNARTACPIWSNFFLCNQGLNTLLLVLHKAILGIMATGCMHGVGSVTFFGETRDTILSTGEEIRSPHGVLGWTLFWRKCLVLYMFSLSTINHTCYKYNSQLTAHMIFNLA